MRRREFITLLDDAGWGLTQRAGGGQNQHAVIGFLSSLANRDLGLVIPGFHEGLNGAGFLEGRNIAIEYRWAEGDYQRLSGMAADLVDTEKLP